MDIINYEFEIVVTSGKERKSAEESIHYEIQ